MRLAVSKHQLHFQHAKWNLNWAIFFPIILALILDFLPIRGLFVFKDLFFYITVGLLFFTNRSLEYLMGIFKIAAFSLLIIFITVLFFDFKTYMFFSLRQILVPLLIINYGYNLKLEDDKIELFLKHFYKSISMVVFLGILIQLFDLWRYIDLTNYFTLKGIPVDNRGLSYMFYEPSMNYLERLASTVLDPISLGHILACGLILVYYRVFVEGRNRVVLLILIGLGLILTFSKGAILQVILGLFLFNKTLDIRLRILLPAALILLILITLNIDGILIHLTGFKNSIIYLNIFGHGLGLVGNYAKMFAENLTVYYQYKISDTFVGSIIGQIGIIGTIIWLSFFSRFLFEIFFKKVGAFGSTIIITQLLVAVLSENTFNFNSFLIPGMIGSVLTYKKI